MVADRANVASSFTLIKGAMIEETYAVLAAWDVGSSKKHNLDRLRDNNFIGASSETWLRDVAKVINRRIDPDGADLPVVTLAKGGCPLDEWKPILLWHITRNEFLLRDFLENWLYPAYQAGTFRVRPADLERHLRSIHERGGTTEHQWRESTIQRVAAGLLKVTADFGLLRGSVAKEFASYHIPERSFLYVCHAMRDAGVHPGRLAVAPAWRMFLMSPGDVEQELLRLHQFRKLSYEAAGSLVALTLPCATAVEYAEAMVA